MLQIINSDIKKYARDHTKAESPILSELRNATREHFTQYRMVSGTLVSGFLCFLIKISGAANILEIGTFSGYSALAMAEALPADGRLTTLELDERHKNFAQGYFDRSPHGSRINLIPGPALESLDNLQGLYDLIFIDADKTSYPEYYEKSLSLLKPGGLIIIDNCLWDGTVLDPKEESARAINKLNKIILEDTRVENMILTITDGLHLVRKL